MWENTENKQTAPRISKLK